MVRFLETFAELNKLLRTLLTAIMVAGIGFGSSWVYYNVVPNGREQKKDAEIARIQTALENAEGELQQRDATIEKLQIDLQAADDLIAKLDTSLRLLKVNHRVADLKVLNQTTDAETGRTIHELAFQELDDQGNGIGTPRRMAIQGDMVYLDYWVVKFDDQLVESAAVDRATSICLFRRVFGEYQEPQQGYTLDDVGARPVAYGTGPMSAFEQQIWSNFWEIAHDAKRAASLGIRAAHGEAVSTRLRPNGHYRITLRASDGLTIKPFEDQQDVLQ